MHARRLVVVVAALAVVALAACGSSGRKAVATQSSASQGASSQQSTVAGQLSPAFVATVNRLCVGASKRLHKVQGSFPFSRFDPLHPDRRLLPAVGAYFQRAHLVTDRLPDALSRLAPTPAGRAAWAQIVALARTGRDISRRQVAAAKSSDASAFVATVGEVQANASRLRLIALQAGFTPASPCAAIL